MGTKFILGQEDGTVAGGNARGANAVDLQTSRSAADQVAGANYSVIAGGRNNQINPTFNTFGVIVGGEGNSLGNRSYGFIGGGQSNIALGTNAFIGGGSSNYIGDSTNGTISGGQSNTVSSAHSTVSGGQSNTASTGTHATVVGGNINTASGQYSVAGGYVSTASALGAVALGAGATATGTYSLATGVNTFASATISRAFGLWSEASLYGQTATQAGRFNGQSDAQSSSLIARIEATLTTGGTTVLSLDGTGVTNLVIPSNTNRMWNVQVRWVAVVTTITGTATGVTVGDTKVSTDLLAVAKRGGITTVGTHTSAGTSVIETIAGSLSAVNITYSAGASQQMAITFTGPTFAGGGSVTMRVVAAISLTEIFY